MSASEEISVTIRRERPDQPDVVRLIEALDAYHTGLYPAESNRFLAIAEMCDPAVVFLVARRQGVAVGCGAVLLDPRGFGEIKRMYVETASRGQRIGARVLAGLEAAAASAGLPVLRLETGIHNAAALAAYRRAGYGQCPPFGSYQADPLSVFMEKRIEVRATAKGAG